MIPLSKPDEPDSESPRSGSGKPLWDDDDGDRTQIMTPPPGGFAAAAAASTPGPAATTEQPREGIWGSGAGSDPPAPEEPAATTAATRPYPSGTSASNPEPAGYEPARTPEPTGYADPPSYSGQAASSYPSSESSRYAYAEPRYESESAATAVYPPISAPPYAPVGYPQQPVYTPSPIPTQVPPPATAVAVSGGNRGAAGLVCALIGLVLVAGGVYLAAKFGFQAAGARTAGEPTNWNRVGLAIGGAALLLLAAALNGWSGWATLIPGLALGGLGTWAFVSRSGLEHLDSWSNWILKDHELTGWNLTGFTMILGLVLLGASIGAFIARSGGRRAFVTPR